MPSSYTINRLSSRQQGPLPLKHALWPAQSFPEDLGGFLEVSLALCDWLAPLFRTYAGKRVSCDFPAFVFYHVRLVNSPHRRLCFFRVLVILSGL